MVQTCLQEQQPLQEHDVTWRLEIQRWLRLAQVVALVLSRGIELGTVAGGALAALDRRQLHVRDRLREQWRVLGLLIEAERLISHCWHYVAVEAGLRDRAARYASAFAVAAQHVTSLRVWWLGDRRGRVVHWRLQSYTLLVNVHNWTLLHLALLWLKISFPFVLL